MQGVSQMQVLVSDLATGTDLGHTHLKRRERFLPPHTPRKVNLSPLFGQMGVPEASKLAFCDFEFLAFKGITDLENPNSFFRSE